MNAVTITILIIFLLIFLNALFSMSELAIVSARKNRMEQLADDGDKNAKKVLELANNPNRILSATQIGITLIGILSGAFGGATISDQLAKWINTVTWLAPYSQVISVAVVVILITYFSLVLGELVPKRLALNNAEKVARRMASFMQVLAWITAPGVHLLSASTNAVLRLMGVKLRSEPEVTEEDLKDMLDQGTEVGVFEEEEQDMVENIFRLNDRGVTALMTPRSDIVYLEIDSTPDEVQKTIAAYPFSRFPVIQGSSDNIIGVVRTRELLLQCINGPGLDIRKVLHEPLFMVETATVLEALGKFRSAGVEIAIVIDEYGSILGLVSLDDILKSIVGEVASSEGSPEIEAVQRDDGSWLFDGRFLVDELKEHLELDALPDEEEDHYESLSGLVMSQLGRVPITGDHFAWDGYRFEVVDMDGRRVDKVLVAKLPEGEV
jgi:putative hemolysin